MITFTFLLHDNHVVSWQPIESKRNENVNKRQLSGFQVMSSVILAHVSILLLRVSLAAHRKTTLQLNIPIFTNSSFWRGWKSCFTPSKHFSMTVQPKKRTHLIPFVFVARAFSRFSLWFYGERVGVGVQREFTGSVPFIRWSDKMNHETEIWGVLVQLARLQKIVKCRDKHWQLPLWCHVAASFTAEAPWVSRRYSCFLPSRVNKYVGDPLTFHP